MPDKLQILTTLRTPNAVGVLHEWFSAWDLAHANGIADKDNISPERTAFLATIETMIEEGLLARCTCGCGAVKVSELGGAFLAVCGDHA